MVISQSPDLPSEHCDHKSNELAEQHDRVFDIRLFEGVHDCSPTNSYLCRGCRSPPDDTSNSAFLMDCHPRPFRRFKQLEPASGPSSSSSSPRGESDRGDEKENSRRPIKRQRLWSVTCCRTEDVVEGEPGSSSPTPRFASSDERDASQAQYLQLICRLRALEKSLNEAAVREDRARRQKELTRQMVLRARISLQRMEARLRQVGVGAGVGRGAASNVESELESESTAGVASASEENAELRRPCREEEGLRNFREASLREDVATLTGVVARLREEAKAERERRAESESELLRALLEERGRSRKQGAAVRAEKRKRWRERTGYLARIGRLSGDPTQLEVMDIAALEDLILVLKKSKSAAKCFKRKKELDMLRRRAVDEDRACCVCLGRSADVLFLGCRHVKTCRQCSTKLQVCPLCREPILLRLFVYV